MSFKKLMAHLKILKNYINNIVLVQKKSKIQFIFVLLVFFLGRVWAMKKI